MSLEAMIAKLVGLGFRLDTIMPADDPRTAILSGNGARVRIDLETDNAPATSDLIDLGYVLEQPILTRSAANDWGVGRASMQYRDLLPDRLGGRMIASHIKIPNAGPVPDYVHFHEVDFQLIHVRRGWVRLVYEDQGPPFILSEGETVLQPPKIRHRVLESSAGLEVIEIGSPAFHPTHTEHSMTLPTQAVVSDRTFEGGQRFIVAKEADGGGFFEATGGRVALRVLSGSTVVPINDGDVYFGFVREGSMTLRTPAGADERLDAESAFAIPRSMAFDVVDASADFSLLEIRARLS